MSLNTPKSRLKIYFAGSIRGGRDDRQIYLQIVDFLSVYGQVLTEHVAAPGLSEMGEDEMTDHDIFQRDILWLEDSNVLVAEVSTPSLGVGYEIGRAEEMGKPILCLYRSAANRKLSAMIAGNEQILVCEYENLEEARKCIADFFNSIS